MSDAKDVVKKKKVKLHIAKEQKRPLKPRPVDKLISPYVFQVPYCKPRNAALFFKVLANHYGKIARKNAPLNEGNTSLEFLEPLVEIGLKECLKSLKADTSQITLLMIEGNLQCDVLMQHLCAVCAIRNIHLLIVYNLANNVRCLLARPGNIVCIGWRSSDQYHSEVATALDSMHQTCQAHPLRTSMEVANDPCKGQENDLGTSTYSERLKKQNNFCLETKEIPGTRISLLSDDQKELQSQNIVTESAETGFNTREGLEEESQENKEQSNDVSTMRVKGYPVPSVSNGVRKTKEKKKEARAKKNHRNYKHVTAAYYVPMSRKVRNTLEQGMPSFRTAEVEDQTSSLAALQEQLLINNLDISALQKRKSSEEIQKKLARLNITNKKLTKQIKLAKDEQKLKLKNQIKTSQESAVVVRHELNIPDYSKANVIRFTPGEEDAPDIQI